MQHTQFGSLVDYYSQASPRYGDVHQGHKTSPEPASGFSNRQLGDHPPEIPISQREKQIMDQYKRVGDTYMPKTYLPANVRSDILQANEAVVAALHDNSQLWGVRDYRRCLLYSRGDATWGMRNDYWIGQCSKWDAKILAKERILAAATEAAAPYEREAGDVSERGQTDGESLGEISHSIADQSQTAIEIALDVNDPFGGTQGTWWDNTPEWVKKLLIYGGIGLGGLVVLRVIGPPIFGTWLASRQARQLSEGASNY